MTNKFYHQTKNTVIATVITALFMLAPMKVEAQTTTVDITGSTIAEIKSAIEGAK